MLRRRFIETLPALAGAFAAPGAPPLREDHFPSCLHLFVWRNWELVNLDRMSQVVDARPEQLSAIAASMGLPPKRALTADQLERMYVTVIRQNWHVLPESQIVALLGWDQTRFRFTLKEDDFLDIKLGSKPDCEPLRYAPPTAAENRRAADVRRSLERWFGRRLNEPGEDRFEFVHELSTPTAGLLRDPAKKAGPGSADLTSGWSVNAAAGAETASEMLRRFLADRMGANLTGRRAVTLGIQTDLDGWRIDCTEQAVSISASNPMLLIRAVYEIQNEMERRGGPFVPLGSTKKREIWSPRYAYSYFALYGDPLMEGDAAGLPDAYLERAATSGLNGVWIQAVLNTLAPSKTFPEFGAGWQTRLENLRALVSRAARYGLNVYLYLNEPRSMPPQFFDSRPQLRGTPFQNTFAMCTSAEPVRDWIRGSLNHVFGRAPGLGGIFTITMSENHTNCFSHGGAWGDRNPMAKECPRCSQRTGADVIAELLHAMSEGVRERSKAAEIIAYDWGWGTPLADALIPKLPPGAAVLSVSEWSQPVHRGGVSTAVGEYSMSVPGPGPRARRNWSLAKRNGLRALAKTQFNNTWEISAVPWIPVLPLVLQHCRGLAEAGIDGLMPSWTCGGYPSPNLRAAADYAFEPRPSDAEILGREAERVYGPAGAADAITAWNHFSSAFLEFPYGVSIYILPVQHGPANLLREKPTGLRPGMILFPHDAYRDWKGAYSPEAVCSQLRALCAKWRPGLDKLERAAAKAPANNQKEARRELAIARTCQNHFESAANQIEFYLLRDGPGAQSAERRKRAILTRELELARAQYFVAKAESLIGYEASNHYYYTPLDLVEKMLNCDWILRNSGRKQ